MSKRIRVPENIAVITFVVSSENRGWPPDTLASFMLRWPEHVPALIRAWKYRGFPPGFFADTNRTPT